MDGRTKIPPVFYRTLSPSGPLPKRANVRFFLIFKSNFESVPIGILKKEKHFQLSIFREESKSGIKFMIVLT